MRRTVHPRASHPNRPAAASAFLALAGLLAAAPVARGQIFYEPVQYQYVSPAGGATFYYGGSDPRVFDRADVEACRGRFSRVSGQPFTVGNVRGDFPRVNPRQVVYCDCAPYANAADLGYSATDARNDAYANVPRYFRKRDLDAAAVDRDGVRVVPAQAQPLPPPRDAAPAPSAVKPGLILIIPKKLLRPAPPAGNLVADAWK